ncbi:MAG: hypothetical protein IKJ75_03380 [Clostridia bacterium]|nr:hypothetical protein [Clostridia bacterium]
MAFSLIILFNYFDKSVDNNDCVKNTLEESRNDSIGTTLEESDNEQNKIINIPEHISNILSKEHMIDKATTQYSVLYGYNNNREMYVFTAPIIEKIGEIIVDQPGWYEIDLTDYVKKLIDNGYDGITDNSFVLAARSAENGEVIFASADNSCAPPHYKVVYKNHD